MLSTEIYGCFQKRASLEPVRLSPMKNTQPSGTRKLALHWVMPCRGRYDSSSISPLI